MTERRRADEHARGSDVEASERDTTAFGSLLSAVPADIRDASFPLAMRGYERRAVDAYVTRVNRVIAELEIARSPESAIKHALERVGEQTTGVLQRAREAAEELTATALAEAEHATRRAKIEAAEVIDAADVQARELRESSQEEAAQRLAAAQDEAHVLIRSAEKRANRLQEEGEERVRVLEAQIDEAMQRRRALLEQMRGSAAELERWAGQILEAQLQPPDGSDGDGANGDGVAAWGSLTDEAQPTQQLPVPGEGAQDPERDGASEDGAAQATPARRGSAWRQASAREAAPRERRR